MLSNSKEYNPRIKALVTGAGALLGQGIIKSLIQSDLNVEIIAVDPNPLSVGLYMADKSYIIPMAKDPDYMEKVERVIETTRPDIIFIGTDVELEIFAENRERLEKRWNTKVVVSSPSVIKTADDKWLTYLFLKYYGFDYPKSALYDSEMYDLVDEVGFPLIIKPRVGARSVGVSVINSLGELPQALNLDNPIIQECVATSEEEYTAGTIVFDGKCEAVIVMRRDLRDGNTYRAYVDTRQWLADEVASIAEQLNPSGPCNLQFRLDGDKVKVFEINARFSGTTPLRAKAGFNEVEMITNKILFDRPIVQPNIKPVTILRYWEELVIS